MSPPSRPERRRRRARPGPAGSSRPSTAVALIMLLAAEGATVLSVRSLLGAHVFIGMLLIPPVLVKTGSTAYRFVRYYSGSPAYRRKGPPPWILRALGPAVVALTLVVLGTGLALVYTGPSSHRVLLTAHKASFVAWFGAMTVHVLGHLPDTLRVGFRDWTGRGRQVGGARLRRTALLVSLVTGTLAGALVVGRVAGYLATGFHGGG